jgi:hypothetical protein
MHVSKSTATQNRRGVIMFDANTAYGLQIMASEHSADDLRAARR